MLRCHDTVFAERRARRSGLAPASMGWRDSTGAFAVHVSDSLRVPLLTRGLQNTVLGLLLRGEQDIVLDLTRVTRIDAAGVGELIRAYNLSAAAGGSLQIVHATPWVREVLERVQLFELLSGSVAQVR
jgi:anti-anti-sigma regulatory factor